MIYKIPNYSKALKARSCVTAI